MKRFLCKASTLFSAALIFAAVFAALLPAKKAKAATYGDVTRIVENYWKTVTSNGSQEAFWNKHFFADELIRQTNAGDYLSAITRTPCSVTPGAEHLYANGCSSNNWYGYSQCWGFTLYIGWLSTGAVNEGAGYGVRYYSLADNFEFLPGDHIRYGWRENGTTATHSLFIYKVEGGTVYTIECNWGANCKINLRTFSAETMRYNVNRFNNGDNSDFLFRPYAIDPAGSGTNTSAPPTPTAPAVQAYTDTLYSIAGGFEHGEGQNADKTAFYLPKQSFSQNNGSQFTLDMDCALEDIPNGFYCSDEFISKDITGQWAWYSMPYTVTQAKGVMEFTYWYYPCKYRILYDMDGGENAPDNPENYNVLYGVSLERPLPRLGYLFMGWTVNGEPATGINEGCGASFASTEEMYEQLGLRDTGDVCVKANWKKMHGRLALLCWKTLGRPAYMTDRPAEGGENK